MTQPTLFSRHNAPPAFSGSTFDESLDGQRLTSQLERVRRLMLDGQWRTLSEMQYVVCGSETALSARLRQLRKEGYTVESRRRGNTKRGLWEYQVKEPQ